jgi:hypothetical protein
VATTNAVHDSALTLTSGQVWRELQQASFAVLSYPTPNGAPRSSGVVYAIAEATMYVVVGSDSWKARHIALCGQVAVTVPIRRGGIMSLLFPIPPATISFHGDATVRGAADLDIQKLPRQLVRLLPSEGRATSSIIEIHPRARFVTYGVGVPLMQMRHPALSKGLVPVGPH